MSIALSIFVVAVTIYIARLQYKKDLKFYSGLNYDKNGKYTLELYLFNAGNIPLYIKNVQINKIQTKKICRFKKWREISLGYWKLDRDEKKNFLASKMHTCFEISLKNCNSNIKKKIHRLRWLWMTNGSVG